LQSYEFYWESGLLSENVNEDKNQPKNYLSFSSDMSLQPTSHVKYPYIPFPNLCFFEIWKHDALHQPINHI